MLPPSLRIWVQSLEPTVGVLKNELYSGWRHVIVSCLRINLGGLAKQLAKEGGFTLNYDKEVGGIIISLKNNTFFLSRIPALSKGSVTSVYFSEFSIRKA